MQDTPVTLLYVADPPAKALLTEVGCWVAVASAEHVLRGRQGGFMQVCHGKAGPLRRVSPGDRVAYYSPTVHFGGKDRLQAFTAIGTVLEGDPYEVDLGDGFRPFRRDVGWDAGTGDAGIAPLLDRLSFTAGRQRWGYALRFGLLRATPGDLEAIGEAMRAVRRVRSRDFRITISRSGNTYGDRHGDDADQQRPSHHPQADTR
jgi:hypothetical protein